MHDLIYGMLDIQVEKQSQICRMIRCFRHCDWDRLLEDMCSTPWCVMDSLGDSDDQWVYWKQLFDDIVGSHIPTKRMRVRKKSLP